MVAILALVIPRVLFFSEYYTELFSITTSISYWLATCLMGQLAFRFFTWFKRNKSLMIFIYRLASVSASIYVSLIADIFYVEIVVHQPALTTQKSPASF